MTRPVIGRSGRFALVTGNANGDDWPKKPEGLPRRTVLGTVETNPELLRKHYPGLRHRLPGHGLALSASHNPDRGPKWLELGETEVRRFHRSGRALGIAPEIRTPMRGLLTVDAELFDQSARFGVTHMINSAWPRGGKDRFTAERRELWFESWHVIDEWAEETLDLGMWPFLVGDFNRFHCPTPPGMRKVTGPDLDAIFVPQDARIQTGEVRTGPKAGHSGRVHHNSLGVAVKVRRRKHRETP